MNDLKLQQHLEQQQGPLLERLYGDLHKGIDWKGFLGHLVHATQSRSARMLLLNSEADQVLASTKVNIDTSDHQRYVDYYVNTCPWRNELSQKSSGQLYSTYLDFSCHQQRFYKTEFFNDWARQQDIHHGLCGTVFTAGVHKVQLLVQRTQGQGHYTHRATHLINGLLPHLRQALRLEKITQTMQGQAQASIFAAEARPLPFFLLDEKGTLVYKSPRCEPLIAQWNMIYGTRELRFREPIIARRFWQAFHRVSKGAAGLGASEEFILIHRVNRTPLHCFLTPLHPSLHDSRFFPASAYMAVYIYDPEQVIAIDTTMLTRLFKLTESEARVARDIALGMELQNIAERNQRSLNTIRAQLKSIFTKTGYNRQNLLTAAILQSPAVSW